MTLDGNIPQSSDESSALVSDSVRLLHGFMLIFIINAAVPPAVTQFNLATVCLQPIYAGLIVQDLAQSLVLNFASAPVEQLVAFHMSCSQAAIPIKY